MKAFAFTFLSPFPLFRGLGLLFLFLLPNLACAQEIGLVVVDTIDICEVLGIGSPLRYMGSQNLCDFNEDSYDDFVSFWYSSELDVAYAILFYGDSDISLGRKTIIRRQRYSDLIPAWEWTMIVGSNVGDVNGDGWDDLLLGMPEATDSLWIFQCGFVSLYYGGPHMDSLPDWTYSPYLWYNYFGGRIIPIGDDNGDGYADFVVVGYWGDFDASGWIYLFYGSADTPYVERVWQGETDSSYLGYMTYVGDFNGDGLNDILTQTGHDVGTDAQYFIIFNSGRLADGELYPLGFGHLCSTTRFLESEPLLGIPYAYDFDIDERDEVLIEGLLFDFESESLLVAFSPFILDTTDPGMWWSWIIEMIHNPFDCFFFGGLGVAWYGEDFLDTICPGSIDDFPLGKCIGDVNDDGYDELLVNGNVIITTNPDYNLVNPKNEETDKLTLDIAPNPSNALFRISFSSEIGSDIEINVYDLGGQRVTSLYSGQIKNEMHSITWRMDDLSTGIYLVRLKTANEIANKKVLIIK